MKITKLVILFNYPKILLGFLVSLGLFLILFLFANNDFLKITLAVMGTLIVINIFASLFASYLLYDKSKIYDIEEIAEKTNLRQAKKVALIHASFDPISTKLHEKFPNLELTVCDIYGNRHEHDKGIHISKKVFPPNPQEIKIHPNNLPFEDESQNIILAITAIHEVLDHKTRVEFFKEAKRVLVNDGIIVISEQFRDLVNFTFFNIGAFHFLSEMQWRKAINEAGLQIIGNEKITPFANRLVIKKNVA